MKKLLFLLLIFTFSVNYIYSQGKVSSKVFFNYSYNSDNTPTNEFELDRVYLTYGNKISDNLSYKFTSDIGRFSTGKDDRLSVYLKNAMLTWSTDYGKFVFGLQGMNMFSIQESNWGYRFIEKSPQDLFSFASSADLGIGYYNKLSKDVNFSFLITNGSGYKKSESDNFKKFSLQVVYGPSKLKDGFNIGGAVSLEPYDYVVAPDTTTENKVVFGGFGAYANKNFKVGAEYNIFNKGGSSLTSNILSGYANINLSGTTDLFARVDVYDPDTNTSSDGLTYIIGGFNFMNGKSLSIAPNIKYTKPQTGNSSTTFAVNFQFVY